MPEQTEIADEIVAYLSRQPDAKDTLEGIMGWWVRGDKGSHGMQEIRDALKLLIDTGEVVEIKDKEGKAALYRAKKKRQSS